MKTTTPLLQKISNTKLINSIRQWALKHRKLSITISIILAVCIVSSIVFAVISNNSSDKKPINNKGNSSKPAEVTKYYSPLTGVEVENEAMTTRPVTGVMIENSPEARPQSGLKNSGVVFEAICEGGITRFLVLYQEQKPQLIGPVRSVRAYYLSWAAGFQAALAHVGGSAEALGEIRKDGYRDLDQFVNSGAYWRDNNKYAPHNMYTSFDKLDALNTAKGYITSEFIGFKRIDVKKLATVKEKTDTSAQTLSPETANTVATNIDIHISGGLFDSSYIYNPKTKTYARSQAGEPHLDQEDGQITPSVVIAMNVDETSLRDAGNHESIATISSGKATIFQNGIAIEAIWTKPSQFENISFTDGGGEEIPLVRGQTWIAAVPNSYGSVSYN